MNQINTGKLYGFRLNNNVLFSIVNRRLFYYVDELSDRTMGFKTVSLSEAQSRLLICLLKNYKNTFIYKDEILRTVWDELNLPSSNQRLWQTLNELRKKLSFIGFPDDFIINVHGIGYSINSPKVELLYIL